MLGKVLKISLIIAIAILAVVAVWGGWAQGRAVAQSKQILRDTKAMQEAFEYFYKDQGRYPSTDEFLDQNIMRTYLTNFPPQEFATKNCAQTYQYLNPFPENYELRFCLPTGSQGFVSGWNRIEK
ncbi:MAG: hypothetical protein R3B41_03985 [Candidatus Doudnabacteria bacterium]